MTRPGATPPRATAPLPLRYEARLDGPGEGGPSAHVAFTGRAGGASTGPWAGLNLGDRVADDPAAVAENRARLARRCGLEPARLAFMHQVHGRTVVEVTAAGLARPREADAMLTREPGIGLVALGADCVPVVLADPGAGVVGVAHAGRVGLVAGVVQAVVAAMRDAGATALHAWVGPAVCPRCYEVPAALRDEVARAVPQTASWTRRATPSVDVAGGVVGILRREGVEVDWPGGCTVEDDDLFSHRRDGVTGRHAGVAWLTGPGDEH